MKKLLVVLLVSGLCVGSASARDMFDETTANATNGDMENTALKASNDVYDKYQRIAKAVSDAATEIGNVRADFHEKIKGVNNKMNTALSEIKQ